MANFTGQKIITMDTVGMVFDRPTKVTALYLIPNAAGDQAIFNFFPLDAGNVVSDSAQSLVGTITSGTTLTDDDGSRNVLTAARFPYKAALRIKQSTGDRKNLGLRLITAAGNNDLIVVGADAVTDAYTNETSKIYSIDALTARLAFHLKSQATTLLGESFIIPGGVVLPNLALDTLTASAKVLIYTD